MPYSPGWTQIHHVAEDDFGLLLLLYFPSARLTGVHHHVQFYTVLGFKPRDSYIHARQTLYPQSYRLLSLGLLTSTRAIEKVCDFLLGLIPCIRETIGLD